MARRRNFIPEFKAEVVLEALRGQSSQAELCRRHNLSEQQISKWKQQIVVQIKGGTSIHNMLLYYVFF